MGDEGEQIHVESGSNAGKWVLMIVALLVVAAAGYGYYSNRMAIEKLNADLTGRQAQVKELQNRMQTAEAEGEALAQQPGAKELARAPLSCRRSREAALA
jgi:uncharacterized protein HemX